MSSTRPSTKTINAQPSGLFKIPPELRLEIYKLTFKSYSVLDDREFAPLLQVCHTIREEAMSCFYHRIIEDQATYAAELAEAKEKLKCTLRKRDSTVLRRLQAGAGVDRAEETLDDCWPIVEEMVERMVEAGFPVQAWIKAHKKA